jgi:hypothetical protein
LHIGHASILDQAHGLKLELSRKLPSLHDPPPAPTKTPNSVSSEPGAGQEAQMKRLLLLAGIMLISTSAWGQGYFGGSDGGMGRYHGVMPNPGPYRAINQDALDAVMGPAPSER